MKLNMFKLRLIADKPIHGNAAQLRGFFATKFNDYQILHQHNADKFIYSYPRVQYKVIHGNHLIIGINEGAEVLMGIYDHCDHIVLGENRYNIVGQQFSLKECELSITDKPLMYTFTTPWLALNKNNYREFYACRNHSERSELLSKTLVGNILSVCKSFDYMVPDRITTVVNVKAGKTLLKTVYVMSFYGTFIANFNIPDLFGLGKSVSRGYGAVKRCS